MSVSGGAVQWADLHVHTTFSDGTLTPGKVVERADRSGLRAIAITDHDMVGGVPVAREAAVGTGLEVIPGVELSAVIDEHEIHILGYFIDPMCSELRVTLAALQSNRLERMEKMIELLTARGLDLDICRIREKGADASVGRLHLARSMLEQGKVRDLREAFDKYIGDGKPCHVRHKRLDYSRAINLIHSAGGVSVLAHPGTMGDDSLIPRYVKAGLRGIEAYHSRHNKADRKKYADIAEEYGLLVTGGSDCHGPGKRKATLGSVKISYELVEKLKEESLKIKNGV